MRLTDWRGRLQEALNELYNAPFAWGTNDCLTGLTAKCVEAVIGEDVAEEHRGKYDSATSAIRYLRSLGYEDLGAAVSSRFDQVHPAHAWVGDIAIVPGSYTGIALGIFLGERIAVLGQNGYGTVDRSIAVATYRVDITI